MTPKLSIILLLALAVCLAAYKVIFFATSVSIRSDPQRIFVNESSPVVVRVVPLNRLGFPVPFKHLKGTFAIREGNDKIRIVNTSEDELVFRTGSVPGKLVVLYYTRVIPFPIEIVLNIESAAVAETGIHNTLTS